MPDGLTAFILGAGLGTRLRPLTESLPKPLVPVWNRPLIHYAMDHLVEDLGIARFLVNTHHCPEAYESVFPKSNYRGAPITFRHEPVLLDTAGGLDNLRDELPRDESLVIYNGDILTDLPLREARERHERSGNLVTLVLRSSGDELRVGYDAESGQVVDLRGALRPEWEARYQFTGIYFVSPRFLDWLHRGEIESIVLPMLRAIDAGESIGGVVVDEGSWSDLGDRDSYLDSLEQLRNGLRTSAGARVHPTAEIHPAAEIDEFSSIGENGRIGAGARVLRSVLWDDVVVEDGARLERTIVQTGGAVVGELYGETV